jgi:hypothetical protein
MGLWGVGLGISFPLFFQLSGGIYRDLAVMPDSGGSLATLPLPISILTCLVALAFLVDRFGRARPALAMIVGTIAVSLTSLWLGSDGVTPPQRKLMMILQVMLPLAGLLLGQLVDDKHKVIARAFLVVLSVVVPLQLLAAWLQGERFTQYLYAFSIYSHLQYVPLILVCAFAYSLASLWEEYRLWLCILTILMFVYATRSYSFLAIFGYGALVIAFLAWKLWAYRASSKWVLVSVILIAVTTLGGLIYFEKMEEQRIGNSFLRKFTDLSEGKIPPNVEERFNDWKNFGNGILESNQTLLMGHPQPMPREIRTSPHNWYIDIVYNFGLVSLLPIAFLMGYTADLCWRQRKTLPAETWWLAAIVFYLVVIDSNFKVTLRQPYPGIFAYFMWGLLLSGLRATAADKRGA